MFVELLSDVGFLNRHPSHQAADAGGEDEVFTMAETEPNDRLMQTRNPLPAGEDDGVGHPQNIGSQFDVLLDYCREAGDRAVGIFGDIECLHGDVRQDLHLIEIASHPQRKIGWEFDVADSGFRRKNPLEHGGDLRNKVTRI